ncbi:ATP-binding protein [archaeon]|nr:ATP-binding protein [archaeon]
MKEAKVRSYIEDWYTKKLPSLVERELSVKPVKDKVISIVGPRRAGKTFYFYQLMRRNKESCLYLDFEDSALVDVKFDEVLDVINLFTEITGKVPTDIFLDEVQRIEKWETMVRTLLNRGSYRIFVTGSSSKLLSREVATQLRGRSLTYFLFGFSFREFLKAKGINLGEVLSGVEKAKIKNLLREYLEFGSFPEIVLKEDKEKILKEYHDTIFFKDFVERHELKSFDVAKFVFSQVLQSFSHEFSVNRLVNLLKSSGIRMGKNTVYDYVEKLQDTLAVFFVKKYSEKISLRESWPRKVYVCDTGLSKVIRFSADFGRLMENVVFIEELRRINDNPLLEIFYWKDRQQNEVDFVLKEGLKIKQLIQVTYANGKDEIGRREIRALLKASEELRCKDLLIITWDYDDELEIGNEKIKFIPLWKWLIMRTG